jgi:DNA-binding transcriptional LysR family regulator
MIPEFNGDYIQWLRGFWRVVQCGNMGVAAQLANRTQSAISHQIKALEDEYGVQLFERHKGRKLRLTNDGKFLFDRTVKLFGMIEQLYEVIGTLPDVLNGDISMSTTFTVVQYYLPRRLEAFQALYPNIKFSITGEASLEDMLDQLRHGKVDMAIVSMENVPPEFQVLPLFSTDATLLSPKEGPYSITSSTRLEEIAKFPYIAAPHNSSMEVFVRRHLARRGIVMSHKDMVSYHEAAKVYTKLGMGITFVDAFAVTAKDHEEINVLPMSAYFPQRDFMILTLRGKEPSSAQNVFLRFLRQNAQASADYRGPFTGPNALGCETGSAIKIESAEQPSK